MTTQDSNKIYALLAAGLMAVGACSSIVVASPEGGDVIEGDADIDYGDWTRVVTGEITVIEWLSFQIAAGETVEFIMPSETSRVLNLINSGVPTEIMGTILGNGQVFLVNPSGVIFGQGSVVNVGALYAAAGNISTNDFMNGVYRFTDARGVVENRGYLQGDLIAMVGGRVANHGTISAPGGTVVMAAGEQVLIGEHLGHVFVWLERPTDLANTDQLSGVGEAGLDLAAGDVFSLAAWNTGTIDAGHATMAVSAGHMAVENQITAGDITLAAEGDAYIELAADLYTDGLGVFVEGDVILTDDVQITSTADDGTVQFKGAVDSAIGAEHDLLIDAGNGSVAFRDSIGHAFDGSRLGVLGVTAGGVEVFSDIAVNQEMNFYAPVEIMRDSTQFDVGMGSALFADLLYAHRDGMSDVSFVYDGDAWVGNGEGRTPFQFRDSIGVGPRISTDPSNGAFGHIQFGRDLRDPSRVSAFLFGTGALAGLDLMSINSLDLNHHFVVSARESIVMGHGQKMVSFGSLSLNAKGPGQTLIEIGDLNVLGDLLVSSRGRAGGLIRIHDRSSGEIDFTGNEEDRNLEGLFDEGVELIASGSIVLDGQLTTGGDVTLGATNVQLLNNLGGGETAGLSIDQYPGGVSLDLFRGLFPGTDGLVYAYDLTLPPMDQSSEAQLATNFVSEDDILLRTDDPYLAGKTVLTELGMNPRDVTDSAVRRSLNSGGQQFDESSAGDFGVTIDRLSRRSVQRLAEAYIGLLGELAVHTNEREHLQDVRQTMGLVWVLSQSGEKEYQLTDTRASQVENIVKVYRAIELLELTPLEIAIAKRGFLSIIKPDQVSEEQFMNFFGAIVIDYQTNTQNHGVIVLNR